MSVFASVVESGSITAAAEKLALSKSVVSQHLKTLEQELGVLLIKRSTRRHTLTHEGIEFYESCKQVNKITEVAWHRAQESTELPKGNIKITAPHAFMDVVIAPAMGNLMKSYPLLEPELISSDQPLDLLSEHIDLAIRVGPSNASNIKQRRIGEFQDMLVASPTLLKDIDINEAAYIANQWQGRSISHVFTDDKGDEMHYQAEAKCKTNSFYACLALIKQGAGVGLIPDFQFKAFKSELTKVFPTMSLPVNHIYALHTYDNHTPLSIRVSIEAIQNQLNNLSQS